MQPQRQVPEGREVGDDLVIATAGHIDHGKTALVRALTGVDTDRLPEEKARGISIDIGFAYLPVPPPGRGTIAFVDVPGHERFLRNMLAGVGDAAAAMFVVAADDGVMPQTLEHLEILDLLGIPGAAVAVSKSDRVDATRRGELRREVAALLAGTTLADAPIIETSATTGAGLSTLRAAIVAAAARLRQRSAAPVDQPFRFAIDRVFTVAGSGTVVTGTVQRGRVVPGDPVVLSPAGISLRVRSMQLNGKSSHEALAGQRCALNLAGVDRGAVSRGDRLLAPGFHAPTDRLDVELRVASAAGEAGLRHWSDVILHLGPGATPARLRLRRGDSLAAGGSGVAQIVTAGPVVALHGDRFVLRDAAGRRTLAGGVVLAPFAPPRLTRRHPQELEAARLADPAAALHAQLAIRPEGIDTQLFRLARNLDEAAFERAAARCGAMMLGASHCLAATAAQAIEAKLLDRLDSAGQKGIGTESLRKEVAPALPAEAFAHLLREIAGRGRIDLAAGGMVRLPISAKQSDDARRDRLRALCVELEEAGSAGATVAELQSLLRSPPAFLRALLEGLRRDQQAHSIADRWYGAPALDGFSAMAIRLAAAEAGFTAAQFRDAAGIGRNRSIEVLEYLDTLGITQRDGAVRRLGLRAATRRPCLSEAGNR